MDDEIIHYMRYKRGMCVAVARACGISRAAVYQWKQVPVRHVQTVARILGQRPALIRPDVFWIHDGSNPMNWPPLPHYISEPERWDAMQRAANDPNTEYGEDL